MRALTLPSGFLVVAATAACGSSTSPSTSSDAIVAGSVQTGDPAVVALLAEAADGSALASCTGTLVSSRVVLTAAHCVVGAEVEGATFSVFVGPRFEVLDDGGQVRFDADRRFAVAGVHPHDRFDPARLDEGFDLATVILRDPVVGVKPVGISHTPLSQADEGRDVRLVGYGTTSGELERPTDDLPFGTKRQATGPITFVQERRFFAGDAAGATCSGDSGGPALMRVNGVEVIVGVTSSGSLLCRQAGAFVRVDVFASSIAGFIAANR